MFHTPAWRVGSTLQSIEMPPPPMPSKSVFKSACEILQPQPLSFENDVSTKSWGRPCVVGS